MSVYWTVFMLLCWCVLWVALKWEWENKNRAERIDKMNVAFMLGNGGNSMTRFSWHCKQQQEKKKSIPYCWYERTGKRALVRSNQFTHKEKSLAHTQTPTTIYILIFSWSDKKQWKLPLLKLINWVLTFVCHSRHSPLKYISFWCHKTLCHAKSQVHHCISCIHYSSSFELSLYRFDALFFALYLICEQFIFYWYFSHVVKIHLILLLFLLEFIKSPFRSKYHRVKNNEKNSPFHLTISMSI